MSCSLRLLHSNSHLILHDADYNHRLNSRKTLRDNFASRQRDEMDFTVFSSAGGHRVSQAFNDDTARMLRSQTGQGAVAVKLNIEVSDFGKLVYFCLMLPDPPKNTENERRS